MRKYNCRNLGIIIPDDLKYHAQVTNACKNANIEMSRIRRSFFFSRNPVFLPNELYVTPQLA